MIVNGWKILRAPFQCVSPKDMLASLATITSQLNDSYWCLTLFTPEGYSPIIGNERMPGVQTRAGLVQMDELITTKKK